MYKMTVDLPSLPKGAEVQIDGLGVFENGYEYTIDEGQAQNYRNHYSSVEDELDKEGNVVSRTLVQGPTLVQAFKSIEGITVKGSKTRGKPKDGDPPSDEVPLTDNETPEGGAS